MILERWVGILGAALAVNLMRGLAVFLAAFAVTALAKKLSAEVRHLIWLGVIASFILIPLAWLWLPAVRIGVGIPLEPDAPFRLAAAPALSGAQYVRMVDLAAVQAALAMPALPVHTHTAYLSLPIVWLAGILVLFVRLTAGKAKLMRLAAGARGNDRLLSLVKKLAGGLSGLRRLRVLLSPECSIPFTYGLYRPIILLPAAAAVWPASRLRPVLTHELAHIRRRDIATQSIGYAVCLLFWFLPPLWLAYGAMLREAETCCDQQVINRGFRGPEYARDIVELVRSSGGRVLLPCMTIAVGRKGMLKERVKKVLGLEPGRPPLGVRGVLRVLAVCLCCVAPILALTAQAQPAAVKPEDPLFGTWVNEEYDKPIGSPGAFMSSKIVIYPDGRELEYMHIADTEPSREYYLSFEETWIDETGNHWYKIHTTGWLYPSRASKVQGFWFCKVSEGGMVHESVWAEYGYPKEVNPSGPFYSILYKQK